MSRLLDQAATLDAERAAALAANDAAMSAGPLQVFVVQIKERFRVVRSFEAMARSSVDCVVQHADLAQPGQYVMVSPRRPA